MHACIHSYILCRICTYSAGRLTFVHNHMQVHTSMRMYTRTYACLSVCASVRSSVRPSNAHMSVCIYVCMRVRTYACWLWVSGQFTCHRQVSTHLHVESHAPGAYRSMWEAVRAAGPIPSPISRIQKSH